MKKSRHSRKYEELLRVLREVRQESGLTQTQAAKVFGAHASFICKCETGERRIDVIELASFCKVYGLTLREFLKRAGLDEAP